MPKRPLCFEDGDIIVELGPERTDYLLVPKAVLKVAIQMLAAATDKHWHDATKTRHPNTGQVIDVYRLSLTFGDDMFSLTTKDPT